MLGSVPVLMEIIPMRNPMRGAPFSQDLDRGDGFETSSKKSCPMRNPVRGTQFSQDLDRGDGFENGAKKAPHVRRPYAWDMLALPHPSQVAPGNTGFGSQSRTREPASRLLPLMARTPSFEAEFVFKHFCTLCATLCAGPLISQDLDRRAASKRAQKRVGVCAALCAGH